MKNLAIVPAFLAAVLVTERANAAPKATLPVPTTPVERVQPIAPVANAGTASGEPWKGTPESNEVELGAMAGLGIVDGNTGFNLLGAASKKILHDGWIDDVADAVSLEAQVGSFIRSGHAALSYGLHLRWDFEKDRIWTFYAIGGVGGLIAGDAFPHGFEVFPRFGIGSFWSPNANGIFRIRMELSHELIAAGISFPLWM
jgi:hypothetical protein